MVRVRAPSPAHSQLIFPRETAQRSAADQSHEHRPHDQAQSSSKDNCSSVDAGLTPRRRRQCATSPPIASARAPGARPTPRSHARVVRSILSRGSSCCWRRRHRSLRWSGSAPVPASRLNSASAHAAITCPRAGPSSIVASRRLRESAARSQPRAGRPRRQACRILLIVRPRATACRRGRCTPAGVRVMVPSPMSTSSNSQAVNFQPRSTAK